MSVLRRAGRGFLRGWKAFWLKVAWVQAIIILFLVYLIPLGLTSLICMLTRRDFLRRRRRGRETFWIDRPPADLTLDRAQRQF